MKRHVWLAMLGALTLAAPVMFAQTGGSTGPGTSGSGAQGQGQATTTSPEDTTGAQGAATGSQEDTGSMLDRQMTGRIKGLNKTTREVTLDHQGSQQRLDFPENATVFVNGRLGSWEDLKEGQQVRAAYEKDLEGGRTLRWIEITPTPGTQPPVTRPPEGTPPGTGGSMDNR